MMKTKKLQLISLAAVCAVGIGGAIVSAANPLSASAAVTTTATSIFTSSGNASQSSSKSDYLQFTFKGNDDSNDIIEYRKPLAYKWYWNKETALETWEDTSSFVDVYEEGINFFSTSFAFTGDMNFTTFTVTFNSSENSQTKDELTTNELVFFRDVENSEDKYSVAVRTNDEKDTENDELKKDAKELPSLAQTGDETKESVIITISLYKDADTPSGEYAVLLTVGDTKVELGKAFTNIAGSYAEYTSPNATLAFSAEVNSDTSKTQTVDMISLNGQSFEMEENASTITKFAPTVLAVNDEIKEFTLGTTLKSFDYLAINVCNSTASNSKITETVTYYQYALNETEENTLAQDTLEEMEDSWSTLSSTLVLFDTNVYKTKVETKEGVQEKGYEYVAIKFVVYVSGDDYKYTYYLSDYAEKDYAYSITFKASESDDGATATEEQTVKFLKVGQDSNDPFYINTTNDPSYSEADKENIEKEFNAAKDAYQAEITKNSDDLSAGDGYYFYLPSLEDLIDDAETSYTGLKFTIYYRSTANSSTSTSSNLAYNKLQIPTESAGTYEFRVIATDKNGNAMKFKDTNGRWQTVTSSNIWDFDNDVIPTFTFDVQNKEMEIDEVESLTAAYINSNYTIDELEVNGNERDREYDLYYLQGINLNDISYSEMIEFVNYLLDEDSITENEFVKALIEWYNTENNGNIEYDKDAQYLYMIPHWDSDGPLSDDDDDWETHGNYYEWKESSLSFTPRSTDDVGAGYYILRIKLADSERIGETKYAYQVVQVQAESDVAYGETYWIENNVVTVVFIVIAAVCAVGIVVLLLMKPSAETVEGDAQAEKDAKKGKFSDRRKKDK
jgi:hypothetical protein